MKKLLFILPFCASVIIASEEVAYIDIDLSKEPHYPLVQLLNTAKATFDQEENLQTFTSNTEKRRQLEQEIEQLKRELQTLDQKIAAKISTEPGYLSLDASNPETQQWCYDFGRKREEFERKTQELNQLKQTEENNQSNQ